MELPFRVHICKVLQHTIMILREVVGMYTLSGSLPPGQRFSGRTSCGHVKCQTMLPMILTESGCFHSEYAFDIVYVTGSLVSVRVADS